MLDKLRHAIAAVIKDNPAKLGAEELAVSSGVGLSTFYSWAEETEKAPTIKGLILLTLASKDGRALAAVNDLAGYLPPVPKPKPGRAPARERAALDALHHFSKLMQTYSKAWEDDILTDEERAEILKGVDRALAAIAYIGHTAAEGDR
jgi:hypothetical protein